MFRDRYEPRCKIHNRTVFRVKCIVLAEHLYARIYKKSAKQIQNPIKTLDKLRTREYHYQTHNERHENSPEQYAVLIFFRNLEIPEYQQENK